MKLDYKHFKKSNEDANSITLRHPRGHEIKIAKNAISSGMRQQIETMCSGGTVQKFANGGNAAPIPTTDSKGNSRDPSGNRYDQYNPPQDKQETNPKYIPAPEKPEPKPVASQPVIDTFRHTFGMANGGIVRHYADGTPNGPVGSVLDEVSPQDYVNKNMMRPETAMPPTAPVANQDFNDPMASWKSDTAPSSPIPDASSNATGPTNYNIPMPTQQQMMPQTNPMQEAFEQQKQGIQGQANAQSASDARLVTAQQNQQIQDRELEKSYRTKAIQIQDEVEAATNDLRTGKIDPDRFMKEHNQGAQKFATAIGLILGGMSAGVTGGENPALKFLNQQIDRDISSQKTDMDNKANVLRGLNQQMGNLQDATSMYRLIRTNTFASKLQEEAARSNDPMVQARAQQALGQLKEQSVPILQQIAMRQAMLEGANNGTVSPERIITRSGLVPEKEHIPLLKAAGQVQEMNALENDMTKQIQHVHSQFDNGLLSPNDTDSAKKAFTGRLEKVLEGRYNHEAVQSIIDSFFPSKTDMGKETYENKLDRFKGIMDSVRQEPMSMLKGYGIPIPKPTTSKFHK